MREPSRRGYLRTTIRGITIRPNEAWMLQAARNLTNSESGILPTKQYLLMDRDAKYTDQFRRLIRDNGANVIRLPPRSPNLNAYAERFVRSIKEECLNRMIFVGRLRCVGQQANTSSIITESGIIKVSEID